MWVSLKIRDLGHHQVFRRLEGSDCRGLCGTALWCLWWRLPDLPHRGGGFGWRSQQLHGLNLSQKLWDPRHGSTNTKNWKKCGGLFGPPLFWVITSYLGWCGWVQTYTNPKNKPWRIWIWDWENNNFQESQQSIIPALRAQGNADEFPENFREFLAGRLWADMAPSGLVSLKLAF